MRREQKDKLRSQLKQEAGVTEEDEAIDEDAMDIDEDAPSKKKKLSPEEELKIKVDKQKQKTIERMQRKIQKKWNRDARVNEADRMIGDTKPKFLNSGKRTIGKTNWR